MEPKVSSVKIILLLVIVAVLISGCAIGDGERDYAMSHMTPTDVKSSQITPSPTTQHNITDGFWCRNSRARIQEVETEGRQCTQFFPDGTWAIGFSPGIPMHKTDNHKCLEQMGQKNQDCGLKWSINSKGQYDIGGEALTLSGDTLTSDSDVITVFNWSPSGIP
jgi:hypothetical protein